MLKKLYSINHEDKFFHNIIRPNPVIQVVINAKIRIKGIGTTAVLSLRIAFSPIGHGLIKQDFIGHMVIILALQGQMRHDISIVHYSQNRGDSEFDKHRQSFIPDPRAPKGVKF